jgi:hypothetical protein
MATIITDQAGLQVMVEGGDYELGNNITITEAFTPIDLYLSAPSPASFQLDGKGYTISNLVVSQEAPSGLFGTVYLNFAGSGSFIIQNLKLSEAVISSSGDGQAAGLVGYIHGDSTDPDTVSFTNVQVKGSISGSNAGGLIGDAIDIICSIEECHVDASISGGEYTNLGGLIGRFQSTNLTILNSYVWGSISGGEGVVIGGLIGSVFYQYPGYSLNITNCYSNASISYGADALVGGIIGDAYGVTVFTVLSTYWNTTTSGLNNGVGRGSEMGVGRTDAQMQIQGTFDGWDFVNIWILMTYPELRWIKETTITTLAAKYITTLSACIGATYTAGDNTPVELGIKFLTGTSWSNLMWWTQSPAYSRSTVTFWYTWQGLNPGRAYYYKAFMKIGAEYFYGSEMSFTTDTIPVIFEYPGEEFRTAKNALDDVAKLSVGRYYVDQSGNFQYESRFRRNA